MKSIAAMKSIGAISMMLSDMNRPAGRVAAKAIGKEPLTLAQATICRRLGISEDDYRHAGDETTANACKKSLTETQIAICKRLGISEDDFLQAGS